MTGDITKQPAVDSVERSRNGGALLALLPVISFFAQYAFSRRVGTDQLLLHHPTLALVDWIFVPFNFLVPRIIDWTKGVKLYLIVCASVILNVLAHATWQYGGLDLGHMITKNGVLLPAGWVHLVFSILETVLFAAFVFCRKRDAPNLIAATTLIVIYFVGMGVAAYWIHHGFIIGDVIVYVSGLFFVLAYPGLKSNRTQ